MSCVVAGGRGVATALAWVGEKLSVPFKLLPLLGLKALGVGPQALGLWPTGPGH